MEREARLHRASYELLAWCFLSFSFFNFYFRLMNRLITPPVHNDYPTNLAHELDGGHALCCAFDNAGMYLAVGCASGDCVVWDVTTRGAVSVLRAHATPLCSISWSKRGEQLLTASDDDATLKLWSLERSTVTASFDLPASVSSARLHPRRSSVCLACCDTEPLPSVVLVDFATQRSDIVAQCDPIAVSSGGHSRPSSTRRLGAMVAVFTAHGDAFCVGGPDGLVRSFSIAFVTPSPSSATASSATASSSSSSSSSPSSSASTSWAVRPLRTFSCCAGSRARVGVLSLAPSFNARYLIVNTSDRVLRVFSGDIFRARGGGEGERGGGEGEGGAAAAVAASAAVAPSPSVERDVRPVSFIYLPLHSMRILLTI